MPLKQGSKCIFGAIERAISVGWKISCGRPGKGYSDPCFADPVLPIFLAFLEEIWPRNPMRSRQIEIGTLTKSGVSVPETFGRPVVFSLENRDLERKRFSKRISSMPRSFWKACPPKYFDSIFQHALTTCSAMIPKVTVTELRRSCGRFCVCSIWGLLISDLWLRRMFSKLNKFRVGKVSTTQVSGFTAISRFFFVMEFRLRSSF